MKFPVLDIQDPEVKRLVFALQSVLSNVSSDNMRSQALEGTTNGTPDSSQEFKHNLGKAPAFWIPLEGDIYIPRYGLDREFIDVRSRNASEAFRILLVY